MVVKTRYCIVSLHSDPAHTDCIEAQYGCMRCQQISKFNILREVVVGYPGEVEFAIVAYARAQATNCVVHRQQGRRMQEPHTPDHASLALLPTFVCIHHP